MRYFLPSELYKGGELAQACATHGLRQVGPLEVVDAGQAHGGANGAPAAPAEAATESLSPGLARARHNARLLLGGDPGPRAIELRHLKRVTQPLVDAVTGEAAGTPAFRPDAAPDGCEHALSVALLAIAIGLRLGLTRSELSELGVAALLHDAGKDAVAGQVATRPRAAPPPNARAPKATRSRACGASRSRPRSTPPRCSPCAWRSSITPADRTGTRRCPHTGGRPRRRRSWRSPTRTCR